MRLINLVLHVAKKKEIYNKLKINPPVGDKPFIPADGRKTLLIMGNHHNT